MKRGLLLLAAVALLAACPKSNSSRAREVPVEIDWPDASPPPAPPAQADNRPK